jgi:hypothetical protein
MRSGGDGASAEWYTALPGRLRIEVPDAVVPAVHGSKRLWMRIGEHHDAIAAVRERLAREPVELHEAQALCRSMGVPSDFDAVHLCWRPDYDAVYYEHLNRRSRRTFLFRDEYIFDLGAAIAVEVPEPGHATYLFAAPKDVADFLSCYSAATRDDIRRNRGNIADRLGFMGRVMHGRNPKGWLRDIGTRTGAVLFAGDS